MFGDVLDLGCGLGNLSVAHEALRNNPYKCADSKVLLSYCDA